MRSYTLCSYSVSRWRRRGRGQPSSIDAERHFKEYTIIYDTRGARTIVNNMFLIIRHTQTSNRRTYKVTTKVCVPQRFPMFRTRFASHCQRVS